MKTKNFKKIKIKNKNKKDKEELIESQKGAMDEFITSKKKILQKIWMKVS